ncbi:MAG: Gfo/Idh/MocA family oxidoreductase [Thermoleophilia bacterium]|nr:Gfo/Idh/MocA family oxidoreductase [Thermoleophilia bacterium]MDH4345925.1 Gfo/Idh/MocA family oxidoreductase [Thermoleophilia bacterium]MDH5333116.1 Gfo/Idh/MocA family oxidoreductase [Thermoleophilia bacterium]
MTPLRLGVVGLGRLAEVGYLPAIRSLHGVVELAGVADRLVSRCTTLAPDVPGFAGTGALVHGVELDLVVVATPPGRHVLDAGAAADAGVATLVEKPPAATVTEALALNALTPRPWIGLDRRFDPSVARLRETIDAFVPPLELRLAMSVRPASWRPVTPPPPVLLDLGPHVVDLAGWLTRTGPAAVRGARVTESEASFELELDSGVARLALSHRRPWQESIVVEDAEGRGVRLVRGGRLRRAALRARRGGPSPLVATLAEQLRAVCVALRGDAPDERLATAEDGVALLGALAAAEASAADGGRRVEVVPGAVAPSSP